MRTKTISSMLILTAALLTFAFNDANAFPGPPGVNVQVTGYVPAPPGVSVQIDAGRPYYVEHERRVYIERERPAKHYKNKHYKKEKKHHDDNGNHYGNDKHEGRGKH